MSSIDLAILGMVLEKPQSAYDLQKDVTYHNFSRWTRISTPSVYKKVLRLRDQGYLESRQEPGDRAGSKAVYSITESGRAYFLQEMAACASQPVPLLFDFNVVITNLNKVPKDQALVLAEQLRQSLLTSREETAGYARTYAEIPLVGRTIFDQQLGLYDALLVWLEGFVCQFQKEP